MRIQAKCIDASGTINLQENKLYGLEGGPHAYYVFSDPQGKIFNHIGMYDKKHFLIIQAAKEPENVVPDLDNEKYYTADLIYTGNYKKELKQYYIKPRKTHALFWHDSRLKKCGGCFPLRWFKNFSQAEVDTSNDAIVEKTIEELPRNEWEQMSLF